MIEPEGPPPLRWEDDADGLPSRAWSEDGTPLLRPDPTEPRRRWLRLPNDREVALVFDAADHPVLGRCDLVVREDLEVLAHGSAIDWRRPTQIPALDRPGALPPGAGTAILNLLAWQAWRTNAGPLRYHGPYPSEALWRSLQASFRVERADGETAQATFERFVADAEARAVAGTRAPIDVRFHAAPHAWRWPSPRVCVQRRAEVERIYLDGRAFDRDAPVGRSLRVVDGGLALVIALGDRIWTTLLHTDLDGTPRDEPRSLPPPPAELVGTPLPSAVGAVLREVLVQQAPCALQSALRSTLEHASLIWGDPGLALVRHQAGAFELHAAMVGALPTEPRALLGVLVHLLEGPVRRAAAARLADQWSRAQRGTDGALDP